MAPGPRITRSTPKAAAKMFQPFPAAPVAAPQQAPSPANMFIPGSPKDEPVDWASLLQGLGVGLLTENGFGEGLGQGILYAGQFGRQRRDAERQQKADARDEEKFQFDKKQAQDAEAARNKMNAGYQAFLAPYLDQDAANDPQGLGLNQQSAMFLSNLPPEQGYSMLAPMVFPKAPDQTAGIQEYEFAKAQGFTGSYLDWQKAQADATRAPQQPQLPTERYRNAVAAGLQPGTPEFQQFMLGRDDTAPGPFQGTGLDAQSYNIVLQGDPASPEYAAAYAQLAMPKVSFDPVTGKSVVVSPDMSWARKPAGAAAPTPAPAAAPGQQGSLITKEVPGATITADQGAPVFNEGQGKAAGFADRMTQANGSFDQFQAAGMDRVQDLKSAVPIFGNSLISTDRQQFEQAERNFINAQLRRESGAVISPEEFKEARKQYIPQPGDDGPTLAQKKESRRIAIEAMKRESGPFYKAPDSETTDYESLYGLQKTAP